MDNNDEDDDAWWQRLTLPQVILIVAVLWLIFGSARCHVEVKGLPSTTSGDQPH